MLPPGGVPALPESAEASWSSCQVVAPEGASWYSSWRRSQRSAHPPRCRPTARGPRGRSRPSPARGRAPYSRRSGRRCRPRAHTRSGPAPPTRIPPRRPQKPRQTADGRRNFALEERLELLLAVQGAEPRLKSLPTVDAQSRLQPIRFLRQELLEGARDTSIELTSRASRWATSGSRVSAIGSRPCIRPRTRDRT